MGILDAATQQPATGVPLAELEPLSSEESEALLYVDTTGVVGVPVAARKVAPATTTGYAVSCRTLSLSCALVTLVLLITGVAVMASVDRTQGNGGVFGAPGAPSPVSGFPPPVTASPPPTASPPGPALHALPPPLPAHVLPPPPSSVLQHSPPLVVSSPLPPPPALSVPPPVSPPPEQLTVDYGAQILSVLQQIQLALSSQQASAPVSATSSAQVPVLNVSWPFAPQFCSPVDDPTQCNALTWFARTTLYKQTIALPQVMGSTYCSWPGITCGGPRSGDVVQFTIAGSFNRGFVQGSIPYQIGDLTGLSVLKLPYNALGGTIPPELGRLLRLASLDLSGNGFTGGVPASLVQLDNLSWMSLSSNNLSGTLPVLSSSVTLVDLSNNQLTGALPNMSMPALNMTTAQCCNPSAAMISGMNIDGNNFTGRVPPGLLNSTFWQSGNPNLVPSVASISLNTSGLIATRWDDQPFLLYNAPFTLDGAGNLYIVDGQYHRVLKAPIAGGAVTLLAGSTRGYSDGKGSAAQFNQPTAITIDKYGNLYIADTGNYRVRKVLPDGTVSTYAGTTIAPTNNPWGEQNNQRYRDGPAATALFSTLAGITCDVDGNVYVADADNSYIRKISSSGIVSTLAGSGTRGFTDGPGLSASFYGPSSLVAGPNSTIFVQDQAGMAVRKITSDGLVSTIAGRSFNYGRRLQQMDSSSSSAPGTVYFASLAIDSSNGNLYYINSGAFYRMRPDGTMAVRVAGFVPYPPFPSAHGNFNKWRSQGNGDGCIPTANFFSPTSIAVDSTGPAPVLYVSESNPHGYFRKISL